MTERQGKAVYFGNFYLSFNFQQFKCSLQVVQIHTTDGLLNSHAGGITITILVYFTQNSFH